MLNYKSVRSSEPQIRSNPALRHVSDKSGFQKRLSTLLEPTPLPFPTFQIVKESSEIALRKYQYYVWQRPAHLRSQWLVLADDMPMLMMDPRDHTRLNSLRVPFDRRQVQKAGPVVLEGAWDAQDHILWIWDVVVWEKQVIWNTMPYSKRWDLVKTIVTNVLDCGHPMSDAEVRVPTWDSLASVPAEVDAAYSLEFQPEIAGQRRHLLIVRDDGVKFRPQTFAERKMVADAGPVKPQGRRDKGQHQQQKQQQPRAQKTAECAIVDDAEEKPVVAQNVVVQTQPKAPQQQQQKQPKPPAEEKHVRLIKDKTSKLPDTYRVQSEEGDDLGLAAIRSLGISKELRELFKSTEYVVATVQWYEPFQKYEVRQVHM